MGYRDDFYDYITEIFLLMKEKEHFVISLPFNKNFIYITDPEVIDILFRIKFGDFEKGIEVSKNLEVMLGNGIFVSDGTIWKKHRSIASKMFTIRLLRNYMFNVFNNTTNIFLNKLEIFKNNNIKIDLYNMYGRLTLEAFTKS